MSEPTIHPSLVRLRAAIAGGKIGLPWAVVAERRAAGTDPYEDLVVLAATVTHLCGLTPVRGTVWEGPRADHAVASLEYERGLVANLTAIRAEAGTPVHHLVRVMGGEGVLFADLANPALTINTADGVRRHGFGVDPSSASAALVSPAELEIVRSSLDRVRVEETRS